MSRLTRAEEALFTAARWLREEGAGGTAGMRSLRLLSASMTDRRSGVERALEWGETAPLPP